MIKILHIILFFTLVSSAQEEKIFSFNISSNIDFPISFTIDIENNYNEFATIINKIAREGKSYLRRFSSPLPMAQCPPRVI